MSDQQRKPYVFAIGMVQAFVKEGVKQPAVRSANTNGGVVHNLTIKTVSQEYLDVSIWENSFPGMGANIQEGTVLFIDGPYEETQGNNGRVFKKVTASRIAGIPGKAAVRNDVVNAVAAPVAAAQPTFTPEQLAAMQAQMAQQASAQPAATAAAPAAAGPFNF